jgi:hypothetical protein
MENKTVLTTSEFIAILAALLPAIITVLGGQAILIRYRKSKEQEIELMRAVRERQYEAVQSLYTLFGQYMALYREINRSDVKNPQVREEIMKRVIQSESEVDALLLKIACEFADGPTEKLKYTLGHLRQSVQMWREQLEKGERLPFTYANTYEYVRFKETFAETAAFMVHHIHQKLEPNKMQQKQAADILIDVFNYLNVLGKWQR